MEITSTARASVDSLHLSGRFDAFEAPKLAAWFDQNPHTKRVIVNMAGVTFVDSSGLAALVKGLKRCRQNGGDLYLCGLEQAVIIIFELTGLHKAFAIFPNEDAAHCAFAAKPNSTLSN